MSFFEIVRLAEAAKEEELKTLLATPGVNIDGLQNAFTPAGYLAFQGKNAAANILLVLGASVRMTVMGAICGNNKAYAEELRINHNLDINFIAYKAAHYGNREYAEELHLQHGAKLNAIAEGAGMAHDNTYAEELRTKRNADVKYIAVGAVKKKDKTYAEELRIKHKVDIDTMIMHADKSKQTNYLEFLKKVKERNTPNLSFIMIDPPSTFGCVVQLAWDRDFTSLKSMDGFRKYLDVRHNEFTPAGYLAYCGDTIASEELRKLGASPFDIVFGALKAKNKNYVEQLRVSGKVDATRIAYYAALLGDKDYAEILRTQHAARVNIIIKGAKIYAKASHDTTYLTFLRDLKKKHPSSVNNIVPAPMQKTNQQPSPLPTVHTQMILNKLTMLENKIAEQQKIIEAQQQQIETLSAIHPSFVASLQDLTASHEARFTAIETRLPKTSPRSSIPTEAIRGVTDFFNSKKRSEPTAAPHPAKFLKLTPEASHE